MRIIGGTARGRRLAPLTSGKRRGGLRIRPTTDRAREAIFNHLAPCFAAASPKVLDLFAGTGALGIEALSRGARTAVFADKSPAARGLIHKNLTLCGFLDRAVIKHCDLRQGLGGFRDDSDPFELVFIDPPYRSGLTPTLVEDLCRLDLIAAGGRVVCEDAAGTTMPQVLGECRLYDERRYGDSVFWLYEMETVHA